jgi:hypothetical protein
MPIRYTHAEAGSRVHRFLGSKIDVIERLSTEHDMAEQAACLKRLLSDLGEVEKETCQPNRFDPNAPIRPGIESDELVTVCSDRVHDCCSSCDDDLHDTMDLTCVSLLIGSLARSICATHEFCMWFGISSWRRTKSAQPWDCSICYSDRSIHLP